MMQRPWLFSFGPTSVPSDARDELMALAYGQSLKRYVSKIWGQRRGTQRAVKPRSLSWPPTCRTAKGYVLRPAVTNVTPLKRGARA